jgi:two-component system response regulator GlrR
LGEEPKKLHISSQGIPFSSLQRDFMRRPKILLLDLDSAAGLAGELLKVLNPVFNVPSQLTPWKLEDSNNIATSDVIAKIVNSIDTDMILLASSKSHLKQLANILESVNSRSNAKPIIIVSDADNPGDLLDALEAGAADFVIAPPRDVDLLSRIWRTLGQPRSEKVLMKRLKEKLGMKQLIGESKAFIAELKKIPALAKCGVTTLILGETGTGKELCARAVHYFSPRANKPFVTINCGAIPVELIESELFGYTEGAFTGASKSKHGLISEAEGGTLFLDEIDCLPLLAQVKLLRFLQDKEYRPLGSTKTCGANVRTIAASNANLEEAVRKGKLRQDLYYRLNIISLVLPPLRDRQGDIPLIAAHFLAQYAEEFDKQQTQFSTEAMQKLLLYDWPGNVRELEHVILRAIVLSERSIIEASEINLPDSRSPQPSESFQKAKSRIVEQFEKSYIEKLLLSHGGNITKAANASQKNRRTFWQLIRKHRIDVQSFKTGSL